MKNITREIAGVSLLLNLFACSSAVDETAAGPEAETEQLVADEPASDADDEQPLIEPQKIQQAIRTQYFADAKGCYEALLERDPKAGGRVVLHFEIIEGAAANVRVEPAEGNLDEDSFESCMRDGLSAVEFPVVTGKVTVAYPIAFSDD